MASSLDQILSHRPKAKVLTREQVARSVVVLNIAPQTADEDIVIYFQRQKNGGGEISHVHIPSKGTAVVTFDKNEVATRVLERPHVLNGSKLTLCRFIPTEARQVFKEVKARVNFGNNHLSSRQSEDILAVVKENTGVACRKETEDLIMVGTFDQIGASHKLLQCLVSQEIKRGKKVNTYGDIAGLSKFEVQPQFMKLLKRVFNNKLQEIEEKFCLRIRCNENISQVSIRPSKTTTKQNHFQEGCDVFIDLYQKFIPNIGREEVEPPKDADMAFIQEAVTTAEAKNPVIIEKTEKILVVYAEKKSMKRSVQSLKEKLGLTIDRNAEKAKRSQGNKHLDAREDNETPQHGQHSVTQHLKHELCNEVKLSLYQGDITDEQVDAIVNAANEWLQHGGGVAAAIVRKGGHQIQDESNRLIKRFGQLNVGGADYTSGGSLSCHYVIHAVGPEWVKHGKDLSRSLLHRACLESLHLAVQLNLSSIALTAISSGIFGMPKDICAEVMFDAIEEFSVSVDDKLNTLHDIRIVIIDDPTLTVFQEEFVKRYLVQEAPQETMESPSDQQGKTPDPTLNSELNAEQCQITDPSLATRGQREKNRDVESPSVTPDLEDVDKSTYSSMPESIKVSLSNQNDEGVRKDSLPKGDLQVDEESRNAEDNGLAPVVGPVKGDKSTGYTACPGKARGKGRDKFAPNFHTSPGKDISVTRNRSSHLEDVADTGSQGSTAANATTTTSPPGLAVTQEGKTLARLVNDFITSDQQSNADDSPKYKDPVENSEPGDEDIKNVNQTQDSEYTKRSVDSENSQIDSANGNKTDQKTTASEENFKKGPDTFKEGEREVLKHKEGMSSQDPVGVSTTKGAMQSAMENSPQETSSTSCPYPSSEDSFSPHGVTKGEKDKVGGEQKDAEKSSSQNHVAGPPPLWEGQTDHREIEQRCSMYNNLNNDTFFPSHCGRSHYYCKSCKNLLDNACVCPQCQREGLDLPQGNQPIGTMTWRTVPDSSLPGYEQCGIIVMDFHFDEGIQGQEHSNPGHPYNALSTTAYLPFTSDGKKVCCLLRNAFDAGMLFVIGKSPTTGEENQIIWNGVELKTSQSGGPASYGYPDPNYIDRVKKQLTEKGITQPH